MAQRQIFFTLSHIYFRPDLDDLFVVPVEEVCDGFDHTILLVVRHLV